MQRAAWALLVALVLSGESERGLSERFPARLLLTLLAAPQRRPGRRKGTRTTWRPHRERAARNWPRRRRRQVRVRARAWLGEAEQQRELSRRLQELLRAVSSQAPAHPHNAAPSPRPRRLRYAASFPYPSGLWVAGGGSQSCSSSYGLKLDFYSRPAASRACFRLRNTAATANALVAATYPKCAAAAAARVCAFGQLLALQRPRAAAEPRLSHNVNTRLQPRNLRRWQQQQHRHTTHKRRWSSTITATLKSLGLEVGAACSASGISNITVAGAAAAFAFNTSMATAVLNVSGLAIDYAAMNNTEVRCAIASQLHAMHGCIVARQLQLKVRCRAGAEQGRSLGAGWMHGNASYKS